MLEIETGNIPREIYDRLFAEALPYSGHEVDRMGEASLREGMWASMRDPTIVQRMYKLDGYVVGCSALTVTHKASGEAVLWYKQTTYGRAQDGSKGWFYTADFQSKNREWMLEQGLGTMCAIHKSGSPIQTAVLSIFGAEFGGARYFQPPEIFEIDDYFGEGMRQRLDLPNDWRAMEMRVVE